MTMPTMKFCAGLAIAVAIVFGGQQAFSQLELLKNIPRATPGNMSSERPVWQGGTIDSISSGKVVIDGNEYGLSEDMRFIGKDGEDINASGFSPDAKVIYVLSPDRSVISILINGSPEEIMAP